MRPRPQGHQFETGLQPRVRAVYRVENLLVFALHQQRIAEQGQHLGSIRAKRQRRAQLLLRRRPLARAELVAPKRDARGQVARRLLQEVLQLDDGGFEVSVGRERECFFVERTLLFGSVSVGGGGRFSTRGQEKHDGDAREQRNGELHVGWLRATRGGRRGSVTATRPEKVGTGAVGARPRIEPRG